MKKKPKPTKKPQTLALEQVGVTLSSLTPDDHNANRGTERGAGFLEKSLRKFGAGRSIFVDRNNRIVAGNKTHQQAVELGLKAMVVDTDGDTLVVVRRNDVDLDTPEGREMAIADNRVGEVNLSWIWEELTGLKDEGVDVADWFRNDELGKLLPKQAPSEFPEMDETIETNHLCPKCGYRWSGGLGVADH